jgi:hypothetical protein
VADRPTHETKDLTTLQSRRENALARSRFYTQWYERVSRKWIWTYRILVAFSIFLSALTPVLASVDETIIPRYILAIPAAISSVFIAIITIFNIKEYGYILDACGALLRRERNDFELGTGTYFQKDEEEALQLFMGVINRITMIDNFHNVRFNAADYAKLPLHLRRALGDEENEPEAKLPNRDRPK